MAMDAGSLNIWAMLNKAEAERDRYEACLRGISLYVRTVGDLDHDQYKAICNALGVDLA